MNEQSFETTYSQMADWELARVFRGRRDLVPAAKQALALEMEKRHLDPAQLHKLRPHSIEPHRKTVIDKLGGKGLAELRKKKLRGRWLLAVMAWSLLLCMALDHFGVLQLFWPVNITIIVPVFVVWGHWELRKRPWFWITIASVVAAHVVFFSFVAWPWGTHWVWARTIEGLSTIDIVAIFAFITFIEKLLHEDRPGHVEQFASGQQNRG